MTVLQFLGEWGLRSSLWMLAGALLLWLLRVKNPSLRLTAWIAVLAGSLAMPLLRTVLPKLPVAVLRAPARASVTAPQSAIQGSAIELQAPAPVATPAPPRTVHVGPFDWANFVLILYALATSALLLRLFAGLIVSLRVLGRSHPTGIAANVRESSQVASPVVIGVHRPTVLLPLDWRGWDSAKLDAVLAHECSHIRRHDPAVQFLSAIHRALLWVNPLSWFLHGSIVRVAEEISDNDAIAAIHDNVSYAGILLEFVQRGLGDSHGAAVPMARYDRPELRIRRILNATAIPGGLTRWSIAAILALAAPLAYLAAAAQPQSKLLPVPAATPDAMVTAPIATPATPPAPSPAPVPAAAPKLAPPPQPLPEFEIASIKPTDPGPHNMGVHVNPGGRVVINAFPLKTLVTTAFGVSYWQISGGDEWMEKDIYNVEAKPSEAMQATIKDLRYTLFAIEDPRLREMLQALLIDRFQLKFHRQTKTGDVYLLERTGKPFVPRVRELPEGAGPSTDPGLFGSIGYAGGQWNLFATSMPQLAQFASDIIFHVPVLDRTELAGRFDYRQRIPDIDPKYSGDQSDSFLSYLSEVGLKLERGKGPVETFVIDHASKPTPN